MQHFKLYKDDMLYMYNDIYVFAWFADLTELKSSW